MPGVCSDTRPGQGLGTGTVFRLINIANFRDWPVISDQQPRISGIFCVWGTPTLHRNTTFIEFLYRRIFDCAAKCHIQFPGQIADTLAARSHPPNRGVCSCFFMETAPNYGGCPQPAAIFFTKITPPEATVGLFSHERQLLVERRSSGWI